MEQDVSHVALDDVCTRAWTVKIHRSCDSAGLLDQLAVIPHPVIHRVLLTDNQVGVFRLGTDGGPLVGKLAARLVDLGFPAVTFDYAGFGASGGGLRQAEIPVRKMRNLAAVVDWLRSESGVDRERIGVLAVCASAQYALGAIARGLPVASFVSVAGWFHDRATVAPFYGGEDGVTERLTRAEAATHAANGR